MNNICFYYIIIIVANIIFLLFIIFNFNQCEIYKKYNFLKILTNFFNFIFGLVNYWIKNKERI